MAKHLTGNAAAALLGISRRTLYRWADEGRLHPWEWTKEIITARALTKRRRGPRRDPRSLRYTVGRHRFEK